MRAVVKHIVLLVFFLGAFSQAHATHNRSGEITYTYLGGNTYKIRITTYTNNGSGSLAADRCWQTIYIDNLLDSIFLPRVNGNSISCASNSQGSAHDGQDLTPAGGVSGYRKNIYEAVYTFTGNSWHILYMFDPNRNAGSNNIPNSVNQTFALVDTLFTGNGPGFGSNNSPILSFPPIDQACSGQIFVHNPGAYDPDHDSLSYSLTTCLGTGGVPIGGYTPPSSLGVTINPVTGDMVWNVPTSQGEYNFAILITEWRKDLTDGTYHVMGKTLRDLQVNVIAPCSNIPPDIKDIKDTCIVAGTLFTQLVSATDPNSELITLTANDSSFTNPKPNFTATTSAGVANGTFTWTPSCGQVSAHGYLVTIKAQDNNSQVPLVDFASFYIKVVSPPPRNLTVTPNGANLILHWLPPLSCNQSSGNIIVSYLIYRKSNCTPWLHGPCETGVPEYTGYTLIGTINAVGVSAPTFTDNNNGIGLAQGIDYSYIVVAKFVDGAESYASSQVCYHLIRDVPVVINASVDTTDASAGKISVRWLKPLLSNSIVTNLDTVANPGPYEFRLMQHSGFTGSFTQIYSATKPYFGQLTSLSDTTYTDVNLNTQNGPYTYRVDFYSNGVSKGSTQTASSVFLTATGLARRVQLNWQAQTPWNNYYFYIYKQQPATGNYLLIDSTASSVYVDSNLVDGKNYCYKVKAVGKYSDTTIYHPLINWSQKACATPVDKEAPCALTITASGSCITQITSLVWNNPNNSCSDDAIYYNLYYTPVKDSVMIRIDSLPINVTSYQTDFASSIAGCYAITAVDSFGNEGALSVVSCVDNCPEYELPNIITTNGDGVNDYFIPVKNRFVKDIDLKIYNRWGQLVFETTDPAINWDGKSTQTKLPSTDGTYFYVCDVHMIRYTGIETKTLKGFLQILKN